MISVTDCEISPESKGNVRMPKVVITKYDGTYEKWLSFWNKFEAEIDAADIPPVTKFAHLKACPSTPKATNALRIS